MKNFIQPGDTVTFTATADAVSGEALLINGVFGVNSYDVATGEEGELCTVGVFELPKTQANTPSQFAKAYWNATNKEVTTTATANTLIGAFMLEDTVGLNTAKVRLNGVAV